MAVTEGTLGNPFDGFSFAQSFTATTTGKLTRIQLPVTGMAPQSFHLNIYDGLDNDLTDINFFDPNMDMINDPYIPGTSVSNNLLTDTALQTWTGYTVMGANVAVVDLSLTGADAIDVVTGKTYIVEFDLGAEFNSQLFVGRNGNNTTNYTGGQAFRARKTLSPADPMGYRDIGMAFTITSASALAADFNSANGVNADDLAIWKTGFGTQTGATKAQGNTNPGVDGDVDGEDYLEWQREFGLTGASPAVGIVPEPAGAALALIAVAAFFATRRRCA